MSFKRSDRVKELLRHEISSYIQKTAGSNLGFITITALRLSDDLTDAKVFFSVLGSEGDKEHTTQALKKMVPEIRRVLSRKLESLRKIPTLTFVYDDTPEKAQRVGLILKDLEQETEEPQ